MKNSAIRNLWRKVRKGDIFTLINFLGLAIGVTACLLIFLYVADELSYDRHHPKAENVYRILLQNPSRQSTISVQPAILQDYIDGRLPGVEQMGRLFTLQREVVISKQNQPFVENGFAWADPTLLDIFHFDFLRGDAATALSTPNSIILTREAARKYFGDKDPMGKSLQFENMYTFEVTGVIAPLPSQSHFSFSMLAAMETLQTLNPSTLNSWSNQAVNIFLRLDDHTKPSVIETQINQIVWDARENFRDQIFFPLQSLLDIRLKSAHIDWDSAETGSIVVVRIFSFIALLILALACFNFVNLSVAISIRRAREIGIKKTLGASRMQLILQFLSETFILVLFSILLAALLSEAILPTLNVLTGKTLTLALSGDAKLLQFVLLLLVLVPLAAGLYPALVVSRYKPITAIRGDQPLGIVARSGKKIISLRLRQLLMLLQFAVSTALIVVSLMIFLQMQYMNQRHPGYEKENLLAIRNPMDEQMKQRAERIKNQLQQHAHIVSVSFSHNLPTTMPNNYSSFSYETEHGRQQLHAALISCDDSFFTTLQSEIYQGRDFSSQKQTDFEHAAIINQSMSRRIGMEDPLQLMLSGFYDEKPRRIIGVVEDIHFSSLHEPVGPMVFYMESEKYPQNHFNILARIQKGHTQDVVQYLEQIWKQEASVWPLQYYFLESTHKEQYQDERRTMHMVAGFSGLAILLSVMGLTGLALYTSTARTREVGIRKILGANILEIILTISREFGWLVLVSNIIAWPVAWLFIQRWLESFAYRTSIHLMVFVVPALLVFALAALVMVSISYHAASKNPIDILRGNE